MKHLKLFFALFAMLALGVGNAWAETGTLVSSLATISSGDTYYIAALNSGKYYTVPNTTITGQTFTCTQGSFSNNTLTPPSGAGEFIFTAVDGVANAYYIYNTNLEKYLVATGSKKFGYVTSSSSDYGYWTFTTVNSGGFSGVFSVKHSSKTHYMRAYSNSVRCYDGASNNGVYLFKKDVATTSYTVSYNSNGGSGTMSSSTGSSITILDCSFTAPNGKKFSKWNTKDDGSGTSYNPGAVVTEDLTLFAIWEDLPKYTVTLKDDESTLQQTTAGEVVVLPSRESCDGYTFAGWTASWTAPQTAWTTTAPTIIAAGDYTPTANVNLYPVYTQTENAGGAVASLNEMVKGNTLSDGDKIVIVANGTNVAMYQETISSSYVNKWDCSTLTTATVSDDSKKWWTVTLTDGGFYLGDETNGYLNFSSNNLYCNSTKSVWTLSDLDNGTFKLQSGGRNLSYRSDLETKYWRMGGASYGTNGVVILKLYKYVEGNSSTTSYISVPDCSTPAPAVLVSIAKTAGKTEFTEGDAFEKATITATYDDATTKDVTSLATFTGYDMNTTGTQTVNVTYEGKSTSYTITVNPKPKYTITWNNAGTTTTTEVVQGEALVTLPEPADCPSGKKFMGWTAATSVNNDGSGITYIKPTDKPTANTTYYAVFAVVEGGDATPTTATVSIADYATANSWTTGTKYTTMNIDANITATATGGGNTGKYYSSGDGTWRFYQNETPSLTIAAAAGYEIQTIKVTYAISNTGILTLDGSNVSSGTVCEINAASVTFSVGNTGSATNGQAQVSAIEVVYASAAKTSDYSLDCTINTNPEWTIETDEISFADKYVGVSYTETFTINASNLTDAIALTIDGSNFTVSPTSIATDAEFPQTVTVTYAPTAVGTHNATLSITSGSTLSKSIALTGSATYATIYTLTALADIKPTDKVIIVGTNASGNYAMSNDKGTSDAPDAVEVAVADNKIATNEINILWNIVKDGDNLTIYPADQTAKWLYCLADENDGVRVGTGEAKLFTIDKGYLYTTQTTAARHIGIYNNSDWRCYKPSADAIHTNIKEQSFAFYVLPDTDPSISVNTTSKDFGAVINGKSASQEFEITARNIATPAFSTSVTGANATYFTATINANKVIVTYAPTAVGEHVAALTITETTTSKSVEVALTGECVETVNVATAMALPVDEIAYLSQFEVVYPLKDKSYIYIKDNSGYGLIYDGTLDEQFKAGDRVEGFVGTSSPYKSLPELKAVNKYEDLTITPGVAAEPIEFVTAPTVIDVNKYVVFKNVQFDAAVTFATDAATNTTFTIGSETITLRNNYKYAASLDANKAYDVYGFVATFQQNEGDPIQVQVYFLTAVEAGGVIETYTVTYDANGATGAAPVDETKYQAGQTFYIENQGELVKEGYEFVGWKYNGTVYEAGKQFTMPTENVTFVAQWEEIVVVPKKDFSEGIWVRVTNADELATDDYVVVAAANLDVAMKSYESGNYCTHMTITKYGSTFIQWDENVGVFQLAKNDDNYTIQDVNTKQYLYAAGSGDNNHLKAANEIPTDADDVKKFIWTITIEDGVTTVKATSENRNTLKYNKNSGQERFSCYASGQEDIALYKYVAAYTRTVTNGNYGTICLPFGGTIAGAVLYECVGKEEGKVYLGSVTTLEAGVPYIFEASAAEVAVYGDGTTAATPDKSNGLHGTFTDETPVAAGNYILLNNELHPSDGNAKVNANRAYIVMEDVPTGVPTQMPGRRYIGMSVQGENAETGLDNITNGENTTIKVIENGQLIIIRNGEKFNAQGVRF